MIPWPTCRHCSKIIPIGHQDGLCADCLARLPYERQQEIYRDRLATAISRYLATGRLGWTLCDIQDPESPTWPLWVLAAMRDNALDATRRNTEPQPASDEHKARHWLAVGSKRRATRSSYPGQPLAERGPAREADLNLIDYLWDRCGQS